MAIIVVSTQMGAGGPEIGMALGQRLGYRYVDQELLQDAGRRYGLAEERLSQLDESKPTIFERFDAETRHYLTVLQTTLYITLPYLKGVLLVAALFRLVDSIKAFPLIYILTDGGPGTVTEVTNYYSFIQAFNFSYLGYSSAITVVLVAITVLLSWAILRLVGWGQHGE